MIQLEKSDGQDNEHHQSPIKINTKAASAYGQQFSACFGDHITSSVKNDRKDQTQKT